jgi:hypothetical protein
VIEHAQVSLGSRSGPACPFVGSFAFELTSATTERILRQPKHLHKSPLLQHG